MEFPRSYNGGKYEVTDEGILHYCFSSDLGAIKDRGRNLSLKDAALITPELPAKCIQVGLSSPLIASLSSSQSHFSTFFFK